MLIWGQKNILDKIADDLMSIKSIITKFREKSNCAFFKLSLEMVDFSLCDYFSSGLLTLAEWLLVIAVFNMFLLFIIIQLNRCFGYDDWLTWEQVKVNVIEENDEVYKPRSKLSKGFKKQARELIPRIKNYEIKDNNFFRSISLNIVIEAVTNINSKLPYAHLKEDD